MAAVAAGQTIRGRKAGFIRDLISVSERAVRSVARDPETTIPALVIPVFMYLMTVGALEDFAESIPGLDYRAFQLPVAVLFAVTGISRATTVVADIQSGYFDRLVMTPVNRLALLLGLMVADFFLVVALTIPVIIMGFIAGVGFETGIAGILVFMFLAGIWGLIFSGFPYAIAFKTGNAAAVNTSFLLFFPFLIYDLAVRPAGSDDRLDVHRGGLQPGDLPAGCPSLDDLWRLGCPGHARWYNRDSGRGRRKHRHGPGCAEGPGDAEVAPASSQAVALSNRSSASVSASAISASRLVSGASMAGSGRGKRKITSLIFLPVACCRARA